MSKDKIEIKTAYDTPEAPEHLTKTDYIIEITQDWTTGYSTMAVGINY